MKSLVVKLFGACEKILSMLCFLTQEQQNSFYQDFKAFPLRMQLLNDRNTRQVRMQRFLKANRIFQLPLDLTGMSILHYQAQQKCVI